MRRERGMALIIALLVVAAAALCALTMAERGRRVATDTVVDRVTATARAAASGGVERARWALARDVDYQGETLRIGACDVTIEVMHDGTQCAVTVTAQTGAAPFAESVTQRVEADLSLHEARLPKIVSWRE